MKIATAAELLYGWSPEKVKAVMDKNLLAEIDIPMSYGRSDDWWFTVRVYGTIETGTEISATQRWIENPTFEIDGTDAEKILPERLKDAICADILRGEFD